MMSARLQPYVTRSVRAPAPDRHGSTKREEYANLVLLETRRADTIAITCITTSINQTTNVIPSPQLTSIDIFTHHIRSELDRF